MSDKLVCSQACCHPNDGWFRACVVTKVWGSYSPEGQFEEITTNGLGDIQEGPMGWICDYCQSEAKWVTSNMFEELMYKYEEENPSTPIESFYIPQTIKPPVLTNLPYNSPFEIEL